MNRKWKLLLCLSLAALTLCACSSGSPQNDPPVFAEVTQILGPTDTPSPEPVQSVPDVSDQSDPSIFSANPYDLSSDFTEDDAIGEEDYIDTGLTGDTGLSDYDAYASAEGTVYPFAGSTPIPLDPVDMPSPTPRPALAFTNTGYTATFSAAAGVSFEAPVGWTTDAQSDVFTLSEPLEQMKDNQLCVLTIAAVPVNNNYSESNLKTEVKQRLETLSAVNYTKWSPSLTATRYLLGSKGVYANYSGTLADGTQVGGRIHYTCVDKVLYSVEIVFPLEYKEDFLTVFSKVRETIKRVQ